MSAKENKAICADGQGVEEWEEIDELGMRQQLGAIPAPGQSG